MSKLWVKVRASWKAVVASAGTLIGMVLAAATDNLSTIDWSAVDGKVLRTAVLVSVSTGTATWFKTNFPGAVDALDKGKHSTP